MEDIHKGTVFDRLELGVNAIAHSCYDSRTVGKKDKVSFVVTHINEERNVAVGIITRIIKQNNHDHPSNDMIPSSRTQKYKNLLGGILCPEKVKLMQ